jgi:outer membrane protein
MNKLIIAAVMAGLLKTAQLGAQETNMPSILTLDAARQLALQNHPRIVASRFQVGAAQEAVKEARSAELPAASLFGTAAGEDSGSSTRIMAGGLNNPSVYDRLAGGLGVSQLITDFGRTANLTASSRFQERAESENAADVREQVWLQVSTSYYGVLDAQAVLQVAQQTVASRRLMLEQVTTLATNKLRSQLDVSFGQVLLEQGQLLVERAQNGVDAAMARFTDDLGLREKRSFQLEEPPPSTTGTNEVEELIQTALAKRPELLSLRAQIEAARRFARAERDARLPTISALGVIGNSPIHDDRLANNYAAADLNISLPLFAGGLYLARQHRAEAQASAADEQLRNAEDNVIQQVRLAWLNVNTARQVLKTSDELFRNANEAYELAQARYQAQLSSVVELSEAQLNQVSANINRANAHYELLQDEASLDYQTGVRH